ncbi:XdhC family aldehyde oxidoreductase maturation factor [Halodesulfovibrio marinisediminis]|uniref:XdhC family aldehyde oxidoreductase maturation factor n=1 Tax=Halodesulfovibrio marinisediminis TaxID=458711 RepID=UPI000940E23C|nr:XdhC/CoxI family protein [Halodesulfovibrio marinisediminis]
MQHLFQSIINSLELGSPVVRASIMHSTGSTPRSSGAMMIIHSKGTTQGTIGGGLVEKQVTDHAPAIYNSQKSTVIDFDLTNTDAASAGMICGGKLSVFMDYLEPTAHNITLFTNALHLYNSGRNFSFTTERNAQGEVLSRDVSPRLNSACSKQNMQQSPPQHVIQRPASTFLTESIVAPTTLHFIGAGHVAQATARIAALSGFTVKVTDDRKEFANSERFPDASEIHVLPSLSQNLPIDPNTSDYLIIMTRGHLHDKDVLAQALSCSSPYIGMIGSKKKRAATYAALMKKGFSKEALERVHCPIGVSISAETPEEIAISILAEVIAHKAEKAREISGRT